MNIKEISEYLVNNATNIQAEALRLEGMLKESEWLRSEATGRAERAEAALAEAEERAAQFEKMLKAEEARKVEEPVLDKHRAVLTAFNVIENKKDNSFNQLENSIRDTAIAALRGFIFYSTPACELPYQWK